MEATPTRRPLVLLLALGATVILALAVAAWAWQSRKEGAGSHRSVGEGNHQHTNRLIHETSPYLLQHAHNPVDWYPWVPEAFEKAKKEDKPILLSIGYSACHWCHVMERESFEDEGIAKIMNEHFVSIKVDREERPDVDEIYMTAVQMMTGSGGWPMTTILTPEGKPFFGGTYFPREQFAELLTKAHQAWTDPKVRADLEQLGERVAAAIGQASGRLAAKGELSPKLIQDAAQSYLQGFDPRHGGFGGAPKFPPSMRLGLMLAEHRKRPDEKLLQAITVTLDRMARGGMYDQVGGGFHRYSVDEKWLVPHFEKMLYDNALLSWVYLEAYRETKNPDYRRIATEIMDFVLRELHDSKRGFWSTLDADSEGEEGKFYVWSPKQVIAVLGRKDGELFNRIYDITPRGNFEGHSIPNLIAKPVAGTRREAVGGWAKELNTAPEALWARLDGMRTKLRAARAKRVWPPLDDKVLANWNGLMIRPLAMGYDITGDERYRKAAETAANFLLTTMRKDGKLLHSYRKGKTQPQAFLEDYSFLAVGLLELHRATGEARWLKEAQALARVMVADFWDEKGGTFFTTPHQHETLLARLKSADDGATPSGQSMAALALVRLSRLTDDTDLRAKARRVLEAHAGAMKQYPQAMPQMLLAAHRYFTAGDAASAVAKKQPQQAGKVQVTLVSAPSVVRPGQTFEVAVQLAIPPGWHVNAEKPASPSLIGTRIEPAAGPFQLVSAIYPPAETVRLGFSREPLTVYTGTPAVRLRLKALPGAEQARALRLRVRYQACNDKTCDFPAETLLTTPLGAGKR